MLANILMSYSLKDTIGIYVCGGVYVWVHICKACIKNAQYFVLFVHVPKIYHDRKSNQHTHTHSRINSSHFINHHLVLLSCDQVEPAVGCIPVVHHGEHYTLVVMLT